jgi:HPr kinase/phosphorylase
MLTLHASTVAWDGRAVLISGESGSGKSALALQLMAFGCTLIADDATILHAENGQLIASCPAPLKGLIEARGTGLLNADSLMNAPVTLCITLDQIETERLPPWRTVAYLGISLPLLHKVETGHFAAAVLQYLKQGRRS